jgi:MoaA/NifB/PqqE/SkfB family radical SAM enzyme
MSELQLAGKWFDYADVLIDVMIGYACNVQCDYCSITDEMRQENMLTAAVMAQLADARARGATKVAFGGGEPTIRRSLLPLVRWCRDRGYREIKVPSNGLMYSYKAYAEEACDAGINRFHISFMAHTDALYEKIMGKPGALGLVTQGVRNLQAFGHKPVGDLIIKSDTWMHLADIVEHWAGLGVDTFNLWLVSLSDRNKDNLASLLPVTEMREGIVAAFERGKQLGVTVRSRHIPRCLLYGYEEHIADLREDKVLVVTPRATFALWESRISPNAYSAKCEGCRHQHGVCLGARQDYLERYGDYELQPEYPTEVSAGAA